MILYLLLLFIGSVLLYYGADLVVKGGIHIAEEFRVSHLVIGLTVVAFGTSLPELVVSLNAAISDANTIAIGNIIGSNIANVGLVLGISSLLFPVTIQLQEIKRDLLYYVIVSFVFVLMIMNGIISRLEGVFLFGGIIGYTIMMIRRPPAEVTEREDHFTSMKGAAVALVGGVILLWCGAEVFVYGAIRIARILGVSEIVIGMSIVALGTSLPEFATSFVAALKKQSAISIGNIVGSNLFNVLSVLGITAMVAPLASPRHILFLEIPYMLVYGIILFPIAFMKQPVPRWVSLLLFAGYIIFLSQLFYS